MRNLFSIGMLTHFAVCIVQIFPIAEGLSNGLGISRFFGFACAVWLTWIPLVGLSAGVYGAMTNWGWSLLGAVLFFASPLALWSVGIVTASRVGAEKGAGYSLPQNTPASELRRIAL